MPVLKAVGEAVNLSLSSSSVVYTLSIFSCMLIYWANYA